MLVQKYSNTSKRSENHCILGVLGFFTSVLYTIST